MPIWVHSDAAARRDGKSRLKQSGSHIASEVSHSTVKGIQVISQELTAIVVETCKVAEYAAESDVK